MKMLTSALAALVWMSSFAAAPAAKAGEDFPFFCFAHSGGDAFSVKADRRSSSGYMLTLYKHQRVQSYLPVSLQTTDDGHYWVVYASESRNGGRARREVLAYVGQSDTIGSHGDVRIERNTRNPVWELRPFSCTHQR